MNMRQILIYVSFKMGQQEYNGDVANNNKKMWKM